MQFFIEYTSFKDDLKEHKCFFCCNKNYQHNFDQKLKEQLFNTYKFSNPKNNKFNWLLQKGVCSYEYMDDLQKLNKTPLPEVFFSSQLNTKASPVADYLPGKSFLKILQ